MAIRKAKKPRPQRLYVHPEVEPIIWADGALAPGALIPKAVPASTVRDWWHAHLVIREDMFKLYFSQVWNRLYPTECVRPGVDVEPFTGDEMGEGVREV